jgi:hypothetical protein
MQIKNKTHPPTDPNPSVPTLRFPEFTGEWETKKLGEVFDFKVTNSFSRENLNYENGVVKNIHYGDIHTKFQTLFDITKEQVPFVNEEMNVNKYHNIIKLKLVSLQNETKTLHKIRF